MLWPKTFAQYLNANMAGTHDRTVLLFTVETNKHEHNVVEAIQAMDNNKAIGTDDVHVEMLKANPKKTAKLFTWIWRVVDRYNVVPNQWLEGITVPLFKNKGSQMDPSNYLPLTILSHARKLT